MQKSIAKNYLYNTAYQIMLIIIPFITTPYISRILGVDNIGVYNYTNTIVSYFVIVAQLGLNLYGRREISAARDDKEQYSSLFNQLITIRFLSFTVTLVVYIVFIQISSRYTLYYTIFILNIIGNAVDITWFFQGFEDFKIITIRNALIKFINTLCLFIFVKSSDDLWIYILLYSLCELISQTVMWLKIKSKLFPIKFALSGIKRHFYGALIMFLPQIITTMYTLADKLILGLFSTETQVGLYSQSERIVKLSLTIVSSLGTVMMPRIANLTAQHNESEINTLLCRSRNFVCFLSFPMMAGLIGISNNFTVWFFGDGYADVSYLMCIICPIILLIGLSDLYGMQYLIPTGHMKEYTVSAAAGAIVNVVLNLLLVQKFYEVGVSFATVVSEFTVTFLMWKFSQKYIQLSEPMPYLYLFDSVLMGGCLKLIDCYMPAKIYTTLLEIVVGITLYISILLLLKDSFTLKIFNMIKNK